MANSFIALAILFIVSLYATHGKKLTSNAKSKVETTAFSAVSKALSQFGRSQGWTTFNALPRVLADINGDGLKDIVGFDASNQKIAFANGAGGFNAPITVVGGLAGSGWNYNNFPVTACDVNGDGLEDLVGFGYSKLFVAFSKKTTIQFAVQLSSDLVYDRGWPTQDRNPRFCYDVDGDGKADLIGFADDGVYVQYSNGASFAPKVLVSTDFTYNKGWTSFDKFPRCIGNLRSGCGADIIGFGNDGVYISAFNGLKFGAPVLTLPGQYGYAAGGWYSQDRYPRMCVDMNGDGKTDIVAYGLASFITYAKADGTYGPTGQIGESTSQMVSGFTSYNLNPRMAGRIRSSTKLGSFIGLADDGVYVAHKTS